jgi:N-acetylneuraminic acid mutarotase
MKKLALSLLPVIFVGFLIAAAPEIKIEPLPLPLTNNAVAVFNRREGMMLVSFMGMGAKKTWNSVSNAAYAFEVANDKWVALRSVPGTAGRLGASAVTARDHVYLFGGYILDSQGGETTVSDVNIYEPDDDRWYRGADIPIAVSASVAGVYRDRYFYLLGGWSKNSAVQDVQVFDAEKNTWLKGTPLPGPAVFGHAGSVVDDSIIYIDGAYKNPSGTPAFVASEQGWSGKIDHKDPAKITWTKLPAHPGNAHFRIAAGGSAKDDKIYFAGGSDRPYDTFGTGFDGKPAEPSPMVFAYNLRRNKWEVIQETVTNPTMDQRGFLVTTQYLVLLGGMSKDRAVTDVVTLVPKTK